MFDANVVWGFWIFAFAIFEGAALASRRAGDTLSERTREWFQTNTGTGRAVFGLTWVAFALWFLWHILWQ